MALKDTVLGTVCFGWVDVELSSNRRQPVLYQAVICMSFPSILEDNICLRLLQPKHKCKTLLMQCVLLTYLVPAPPGPAHLPLAHAGPCVGGCAPRDAGALEQLVPVLLADQAACEEVVTVAWHELCPAFGTRETLEVEYLVTAGLLLRPTSGGGPLTCPAAGPHHELTRGDRLPASGARSRYAEHPATTDQAPTGMNIASYLPHSESFFPVYEQRLYRK